MSIIIENLSKSYGSQKAIDQISFEVKKGEITGFLGPNGAGKSTTMKIITGYLAADSGQVRIEGQDIATHALESRRQIGYLPEHNPLYLDMYVGEQLDFSGQIFGLKSAQLSLRKAEVIEMTGLGSEQHKKVGSLSKGYRQRVGLAMALLHDPQVLILDEPTTGLDPNQIIEIRNLIRQVGQQKTVVFSTHILQEVEAVCNRVVIINKGKLVANASVLELREQMQSGFVVEFSQLVSQDLLSQIPFVSSVQHLDGFRYLLGSDAQSQDPRPHIFAFAAANNLSLLALSQKEQSLENIFRELTA